MPSSRQTSPSRCRRSVRVRVSVVSRFWIENYTGGGVCKSNGSAIGQKRGTQAKRANTSKEGEHKVRALRPVSEPRRGEPCVRPLCVRPSCQYSPFLPSSLLSAPYYPGGHDSGRPPKRCKCRWSTDCPPSGPAFTTTRKPVSARSSVRAT